MLKAKEAAERQRTIADKAYQKELGMSTDQFIQLKAWEIIEKKDGANIDVLVGHGYCKYMECTSIRCRNNYSLRMC